MWIHFVRMQRRQIRNEIFISSDERERERENVKIIMSRSWDIHRERERAPNGNWWESERFRRSTKKTERTSTLHL